MCYDLCVRVTECRDRVRVQDDTEAERDDDVATPAQVRAYRVISVQCVFVT
jgi:hypothetical protein